MTREVVFRTHSDAEASIVRGLLEAHGLDVRLEQEGLRRVFPLPVAPFGELQITVADEDADEARRLLLTFETPAPADGPRVVPLRDEFAGLEARLGYRFRDRGLLEQALTHRSRANEDPSGGVSDNESLEFLGDAVLGFVMADVVYRRYPLAREGAKSKSKAALVSAVALAAVAETLGLGEFLLLGRGEEKTGGRRKQALLADTCEALIAAVYLDGGIDEARVFIERAFAPLLRHDAEQADAAPRGDFKSALQERLQRQGSAPPDYRVTHEEGPDHDKVFHVEVRRGGTVLALASGRSKKDAEQEAARRALAALEAGPGDASVDLDDAP
jgi:ribonuclease III